jgi:hypothetical protein
MKTVIANDRIGRFAEIDHAVREEVRVIMESPAADEAGQETRGTRALDWLCAALQKAVYAGRAS